MMLRVPGALEARQDSLDRGRSDRRPREQHSRSPLMKWEKPQALDLRFGMEITMYIAHR